MKGEIVSKAINNFKEVEEILPDNLEEDNIFIFESILNNLLDDIRTNQQLDFVIVNHIFSTFNNLLPSDVFINYLNALSNRLTQLTGTASDYVSRIINEYTLEDLMFLMNLHDSDSEDNELPSTPLNSATKNNNNNSKDSTPETNQTSTSSSYVGIHGGMDIYGEMQRLRTSSYSKTFQNKFSGSYGSGIEDFLGRNWPYNDFDGDGDHTI